MGRPNTEVSAEETVGAPRWMVTFCDCMNLLLTFFVLLVTFSQFGEGQQERIANLASAIRSVFGAPADLGGGQHKNLIAPSRRMADAPQPGSGTEESTDSESAAARKEPSKEDLEGANYRSQQTFLIPSQRIFRGHGKVISPNGRYYIAMLAAFLKEMPGPVVISENGPENTAGDAEVGLSRAMVVIEYLVSLQGLDRQKFSIAAESISPPEEAGGSVLAYHRQERMLEIVLLDGSVQQ